MLSAENLLKDSFLLSLCKYNFLLMILTKTPNLIGGQIVHFWLTTYIGFIFEYSFYFFLRYLLTSTSPPTKARNVLSLSFTIIEFSLDISL